MKPWNFKSILVLMMALSKFIISFTSQNYFYSYFTVRFHSIYFKKIIQCVVERNNLSL